MSRASILKNRIMVVAAFCLIGLYLFLFLRGADPQGASEEYRLFFLENRLAKYLPDGELQSVYGVGTHCEYGINGENDKNIGTKGWGNRDESGIWELGERAEMFFFVASAAELEWELRTDGYMEGYENILYVNGQAVGRILFDEDYRAIVNVPADVLIAGTVNRFEIVCESDMILFGEDMTPAEDGYPVNMHICSVELREK